VGLSGLLVKSAHQMVATAEDLRAAGIGVPILVGGAALSEGFTTRRIAPAYGGAVLYCRDAMQGLDAMGRVMAGDVQAAEAAEGSAADPPAPGPAPPARRSSRVRSDLDPVPPPYLERRVLDPVPHLREVWGYVNPQMLYGKHLGLRGSFARKLRELDAKAHKLQDLVDGLQAEAEGWMRVRAVWRYFAAESQGNTLDLFVPEREAPVASFELPRQPRPDGLCLADYVLPPSGGVRDSVALFVVSAGAGVRERAEAAKAAGEFLASHAIQALALETAEAAAEWLHRRLREHWGFPDPTGMTMRQRFQAAYRGTRYSFGYPACPDLDDQAMIWQLLAPEEIGVELTDGMMMEPEASVSALVFHHPDSTYFSATGVEG
jgi:5-methyltetrahydrofolate--homocysteine methyltransferase